MKTTILTIALFVLTIGSNAQDHYNKKYFLGQNSTGIWYKLFEIDLNGSGNFNSVNVEVDFNYVSTWIKYNSSAFIRLREGTDHSESDWQNNVTGLKQPVLKFKKTGLKAYELWGFSHGGWGHLSFECKITKEAELIINIPEEPTLIPDINLYENVPKRGDWFFSSGDFIVNDGNVGIGTITPNASLEINSPSSTNDSDLIVHSTSTSSKLAGWSRIALKRINETNEGFLSFYGNQTSGLILGVTGNNPIRFYNNNTENMRILSNGNVGIGTSNPGSWKLAVNGKIRAKEIKVETGWADFVFYDDYELPTLEEVETHIKKEGHLKDIPTAQEVEENGIHLG